FVDSAGLSLPLASIFDLRTNKGIFPLPLDEAPMVLLRAGTDLKVENGSLTIASGGLVSARPGEQFETQVCVPGDYLEMLDGPNSGTYEILTLTDTELTVDGPELDDVEAQRYSVFYRLSDKLLEGDI